MVIDICVFLNDVSDLSKYLIKLVIYSVILLMMKKMFSVITHWFLISLPFCGHCNIIFHSSLITAHWSELVIGWTMIWDGRWWMNLTYLTLHIQ